MLSTSSPSGAFWSDSACSVTLASNEAVLAAGSSSVQVYYSDGAEGTPVLAVTDTSTSPLVAASQVETIGAIVSSLTFTNTPSSLPVGSCGLLNVAAQDSGGHIVPTENELLVSLSATAGPGGQAGAVTFYSDAGCQTPQNAAYMAASSAMTAVYATASGTGAQVISSSGPAGVSGASTTINFLPVRLSLTNPSTGGVIGSCISLNFNLIDSAGVAAPQAAVVPLNVTVTHVNQASVGALFLDSGCQGPTGASYNLGAGTTNFSLYFSATSVDTFTVNISGTGIAAGSETISIN